MFTTMVQCEKCKHYIWGDGVIPCCDAFPDGIPKEIFREEMTHKKPYKGDNGIIFEDRAKQ